jgi:hypothetical protein
VKSSAALAPASDSAVPLFERAMTVKLSTHRWTAQRRHRETEADVSRRTGLDQKRHKHSITLLADEPLAALSSAFSAAEAFHRANTSPWEDGGLRLLSNRRWAHYTREIERLQREVATQRDLFAKAYPALIEHERANNPLFDESWYPKPNEIAQRFSISVAYDSIPQSSDFRIIGVSEEDTARIQADIEARHAEKLKGIVTDLYQRVAKAVEHIAERMKAYDEREERIAQAQEKADRRKGPNKGMLPTGFDMRTGVFTDTVISNLKDVLELIPDLDMTDDPTLAALRDKLLNQLCPHTPEDLRQSPALRKRVAANAEKILAQVSDFL